MENQRNYQLLDQFLNRECQVSLHTRIGSVVISTYTHKCFDYEIDEDNIYLKDLMNGQNDIFTELDSIIEVENLCDDVYRDAVSIITKEFIVSVCCLEERPQHPKCHKCGEEIIIPEDNWSVRGYDGYGNVYDGDVEKINGLHFCGECIFGFIGEVELGDNQIYC